MHQVIGLVANSRRVWRLPVAAEAPHASPSQRLHAHRGSPSPREPHACLRCEGEGFKKNKRQPVNYTAAPLSSLQQALESPLCLAMLASVPRSASALIIDAAPPTGRTDLAVAGGWGVGGGHRNVISAVRPSVGILTASRGGREKLLGLFF